MDPVLQELSDRNAIRDVMVRYAHGVDRRDFAMVAECFARDAEADYGRGKLKGIQEIIAFIRGIERYESTNHFMMNQLVDQRGDVANVETYAMDRLRYKKDGKQYEATGSLRYVDQFAREGGRWVVRKRVMHTDFRRHDLVQPPPGP